MSEYLQPETMETTEGNAPASVSGNDTGDDTETGGSLGGGGTPETGGGGEGAGSTEVGTGDAHGTPVVPSPSGGNNTLPDTPASGQFMQGVLGSLDSISGKLDADPSFDSLSESLRSLVGIMAMQAEEDARKAGEENSLPVPVPLLGYEGYAYPVTVAYRLYPSGLGSEADTVEGYQTAEDFQNGYTAMRDSLTNGDLSWFSILSVDDADGVRVYDADSLLSAEGEELTSEEEPDTFKEDVLASLNTLHGDLQSVSGNDIGYYDDSLDLGQSVYDLQAQCMELQEENLQLSYHMLACDIATGFVLLLALGYTIAHGFFQRMKAG